MKEKMVKKSKNEKKRRTCYGCKWGNMASCQNNLKCIDLKLYEKGKLRTNKNEDVNRTGVNCDGCRMLFSGRCKEIRKCTFQKLYVLHVPTSDNEISEVLKGLERRRNRREIGCDPCLAPPVYIPPLEQSIISTVSHCGYEIQNMSIDKQLLNEDTEVVDIVLRVVRDVVK